MTIFLNKGGEVTMIHFGNERCQQAAAFALRYDVFVLEQGIDPTAEFDALDSDQRYYFVYYQQHLPVGTVRYQAYDQQTIQPDRLCVKQANRQQGIGRQLLLNLENQALKDGYTQSRLSAEVTAKNFYKALGYQVDSLPYIEDGLHCVRMTKQIALTTIG